MKTEVLHWHHLPAEGRPDSDITVLMEALLEDGSTEVGPGWWCGESWRDCSTRWLIGRDVVAWADMPAGTRAEAVAQPDGAPYIMND